MELLEAEFDDGVACAFSTIFSLTSSVIACLGVSCPMVSKSIALEFREEQEDVSRKRVAYSSESE